MLIPTSHSNKLSNNRSEKVVQQSTDDSLTSRHQIKRKRASVLTVQDLIREALAQGRNVSELLPYDVQLR